MARETDMVECPRCGGSGKVDLPREFQVVIDYLRTRAPKETTTAQVAAHLKSHRPTAHTRLVALVFRFKLARRRLCGRHWVYEPMWF